MKESKILLDHGSGGRLSHELISELLLPHLKNPFLAELGDSAILSVPLLPTRLNPSGTAAGNKIAFTTDSYVVKPIFFPGGDIGKLAVCGTINDLAVAGARPLFLSCSLMLEEGFELSKLEKIVESMQYTAELAGVQIVTGDTKVVDRGKIDQIFINTAGIGVCGDHDDFGIDKIAVGDKILINGTIGEHGIAVISKREGFTFQSSIESDCAPLNGLIESVTRGTKSVKFMRDLTRGGLGTILKEIADGMDMNVWIDEAKIPIKPGVQAACELLGFDPIYIANEGKVVMIVEVNEAENICQKMRKHPLGIDSQIIGEIREKPAGQVHLKTSIGGTRLVDMLTGAQLPRIC